MNKKGFSTLFVILGIVLLIGIAGGAYYFSKSQNPKSQSITPVITSQTSQQTAVSSPMSSGMESPEKTLQSLEKTLSVSSPITDQKSRNWINSDKHTIPLKGKTFGIGTFKNAYMDKYGDFPHLSDTDNPDLSKITKVSLEPLQKQVNSFFMNNGFTQNTLNTKEITGFEDLYGYVLGNTYCLVSFFPQSDPFGQFFCGVLDPDELSWRKELVPAINPKNDPDTFVSVDKLIGNYATGGVGGYASGAAWYAVKINGIWKEVWTGQNIISCKPVKQYNIPKEIYGNDCSTNY